MTPFTLAAGEGGWIVVIVALLVVGGVVYGYYTRTGSGIDEHPASDVEAAPGAEGKSEVSGKDEGEGSTLDTHGTR